MTLDPKKKVELEARLEAYVGLQTGPPEKCQSAVNEAMIRHWCDIMEDRNPVYTDPDAAKNSIHGELVAPPAMLHAWVMQGTVMAQEGREAHNKERELHNVFDEYGYTGVVGTNVVQHYERYVKPGEEVTQTITIESISEEKATALGVGYFIQTRNEFTDQNGGSLGWMTFRTLRYTPAQQPQPVSDSSGGQAAAAPTRLRPPMGHDNAWWWDGIAAGELLIQKCSDCGVLRHPPAPMCGKCQSTKFGTQTSSGKGSVHTFTVMHYPKFPGFDYPFVAAVIDLEEGTRIVSNVVGVDPSEVHIGMSVQCSIENVDDEMKLPMFRPVR